MIAIINLVGGSMLTPCKYFIATKHQFHSLNRLSNINAHSKTDLCQYLVFLASSISFFAVRLSSINAHSKTYSCFSHVWIHFGLPLTIVSNHNFLFLNQFCEVKHLKLSHVDNQLNILQEHKTHMQIPICNISPTLQFFKGVLCSVKLLQKIFITT